MPDYPDGYASYEAWIESKAGDSPPNVIRDMQAMVERMKDDSDPVNATHPLRSDWPQPQPPPYAADDEGLEEPRDA